MEKSQIKYFEKKFRSLHENRIDIDSQSFLNSEFLSLTSLTKINEYLIENKIDTGEFLFGFKNSLLFFENGFFSRNTKKLYPFSELKKCSFKTKGRLIKDKRLVLILRHSEFNLDLSPYKSNLDEKVLEDLSQIFNTSKEQILETQSQSKETPKNKPPKKNILDDIIEVTLSKQKIDSKVFPLIESIELKKTIILKEKFLNKIPVELNFTRVISKKMKSIQDDFNETQLNKLTRFLSFLEDKENNYNELYKEGVDIYMKDPKNKVFNQLSDHYFSIINYYQIFTLMLNNIKSDKITFNKLYNLIEDEGIFMTRSETETFEYLKGISNSLSEMNKNLIQGFDMINQKFKNLNQSVDSLSDELTLIDSSLQMIYDSTHNIYLSL